jgi:hypothetical protein
MDHRSHRLRLVAMVLHSQHAGNVVSRPHIAVGRFNVRVHLLEMTPSTFLASRTGGSVSRHAFSDRAISRYQT